MKYITIKNFVACENIDSVNLLHLIIHSVTGHFKEKNDEKYLILNSTGKYEEVWSGIWSKIKKTVYEKNHARTGINTDNDIPLKKPPKFPTLTIIIRCVFQGGEKLDPQIYLEKCLYEL